MRMEVIDESKRSAIQRLTKAERECLKRCLDHQTAKQMALELGISPHAVEKRLKMARAKLGLSSSLEAAKLVESLERYGPLGPYSSDVAAHQARPDEHGPRSTPRNATTWFARHRTLLAAGAMVMSVLAAVAVIIGVQSSGVADGQASPSAATATESPAVAAAEPNPGTEAALRNLVAGLASGSPDYARLSPHFAEIVRRDLPKTHGWFASLGELKSVTFLGRGEMGDDAFSLVFANGEVTMSATLDPEGRMDGGMLRLVKMPGGAS